MAPCGEGVSFSGEVRSVSWVLGIAEDSTYQWRDGIDALEEEDGWMDLISTGFFRTSANTLPPPPPVWDCISKACQDVLRTSGVSNTLVKGIGFDATCSLAVQHRTTGAPISVTPNSWSSPPSTPVERDIILWADHRAGAEAQLINSTGSMVLNYVGGTMSLEMEIPKVLWLKNHMPASLFADAVFFDLPDWLTWKATGSEARSNCSLACKCSYVPPGVAGSKGWNDEFFTQIGLPEFVRPISPSPHFLTDS